MRNETLVRPNTRGLLAHAQRKAAETQQRVHQAIDRLLREQAVVNFNSVAKVANVTKSYLYANVDVRERIEALRAKLSQERIEQQQAERKLHQARTDKTKEVLLEARDRRIKALEEENRQLKAQLKEAYGKLYEQV
jgi:translation initiation factor 2 alpha subunit (eIF-2alpha)